LEQAQEERPNARLRVARRLAAAHERDRPLFADEHAARIDIALPLRALRDLEREIPGELRRERHALRAHDDEHVVERHGAVDRSRHLALSIRTGIPARARCAFASPIVCTPSWKIDAARTALACPLVSPSTR